MEKVGGQFVDIKGLRTDIEENEQIDQVLKELSCEYDLFSKYTKPEYRLIGLTGLQLFGTYKKNNVIRKQQQIIETLGKDKPVNEAITSKYADL